MATATWALGRRAPARECHARPHAHAPGPAIGPTGQLGLQAENRSIFFSFPFSHGLGFSTCLDFVQD